MGQIWPQIAKPEQKDIKFKEDDHTLICAIKLWIHFEAIHSSIWFLIVGIPVRHNDSSYLMHHKFVVVDQTLLINGSFNWTRHAVNCNNENILISNETELVQPFIGEFNKLWQHFCPTIDDKTSWNSVIRYQIVIYIFWGVGAITHPSELTIWLPAKSLATYLY